MTALARTESDQEPMAGSRRTVLDGAARLFRLHGYAAVSMRDIAAACGIKAGSLYYHFQSKEQIVTEVLDTGVGTVFEEARRSVEALPPAALLEQRLRAAIGAHLHALLELDDYTGANIRIFGHVPERVRLAALANRRRYEDWWRDLLARGEEEGAFAPGTDLRLLRLFLLGAMNWSLEWHKPGLTDVEELADRLTEMALHGVAAPKCRAAAEAARRLMTVLDSTVSPRDERFRSNLAQYDLALQALRAAWSHSLGGGGKAHVARHQARGKLLARDRIDRLVDPLTPFLELSPLAAWGLYGNEVPAAGIVTGIGIVQGLPCMLIANDATVKGGSFFHETVKKHIRAQEIARENRLPCLYLVDCGGAYLPEQDRVFPDRGHFGTTFFEQCKMSADGIPQLSAVFGGCTAGGAYIPALSDEVVMVRGQARIHLGGPSIVKAAINEDVDGETLGGAAMHTQVSGVSDYIAETETDALARLRQIVAGLNQRRPNFAATYPVRAPLHDAAEIGGIIEADPKIPYDVREVLARLVDGSEFAEFKPDWGSSLVCGTAHLHGYPVGILANNGPLFSESALKGAHFIELCDQRHIPLLFLQNITGFMVGTDAERGGIAKHSAKLVYAVSCARVPRFTVIIGGSYGAGNYGMCGRGFGPRFLFAWPNARIATMSPDVAANVLLELRRSSLKRGEADAAEMAELERQTRAQFTEQSDPYYATARLWDDGIIEPAQTRDVLGLCLALAASDPHQERRAPVYRM